MAAEVFEGEVARTEMFQSSGSADRRLDATHCVPACLLACPLVSAGLWSAGLSVWDLLASLAVAATITLFASLDGIRSSPGEVTEAIGLALSVTAAAIAPSLATGLFKRSWSEMIEEAVNAFPSWLGIMIAPTVVIFAFAADLHPGLIRAQHSFNFLAAFSALATSVALLSSLWIRLHADAVAASRAESRTAVDATSIGRLRTPPQRAARSVRSIALERLSSELWKGRS